MAQVIIAMGACCNRDQKLKEVTMMLHVESNAKLPLLHKVVQTLAERGHVKLELKETPDLKRLNVVVPRYPVLEDEGAKVSGDRAVPRYIAQKRNLYPKNEEDTYMVESLCDTVFDMWRFILFPYPPVPGQPMPENPAEFVSVHFAAIEKRLPVGSNYFVGPSATLADVYVYCLLEEHYLGPAHAATRGSLVPARLKTFHQNFKPAVLSPAPAAPQPAAQEDKKKKAEVGH